MERGEPIPRTNRRTVPSSDGQCFFRAFLDALTRRTGTLAAKEGMEWINHKDGKPWCRNIRGLRRCDIRVTMKCLAMHVRVYVTPSEFVMSGLQQRYADKEAYAQRLERGNEMDGRQNWGSVGDLQIAVHWLGHSNFGASIYTIEDGHYTLARVTKDRIILCQPPTIVQNNDIVLYNSNNRHWMNTVVELNLPAVIDDNGDGIGPGPGMADEGMEEREIIEIG
jgi:hypothetical protein